MVFVVSWALAILSALELLVSAAAAAIATASTAARTTVLSSSARAGAAHVCSKMAVAPAQNPGWGWWLVGKLTQDADSGGLSALAGWSPFSLLRQLLPVPH